MRSLRRGAVPAEGRQSETVQKRLDVYKAQTAPLIEYYTRKGLILNFTGSEAPAEVLFAEVAAKLDELK